MKFFIRRAMNLFGLLLCLTLICFNFSAQMKIVTALPDTVYFAPDEAPDIPEIPSPFSVEIAEPAASSTSERLTDRAGTLSISLFGIEIRQVALVSRTEKLYIPGGQAIGVALYTHGILVVGTGDFISADGHSYSPAAAAGIEAGDIITEADGEIVSNSDQFAKLCDDTGGDIMMLTVLREGVERQFAVAPLLDVADGRYRIGVWSRDSTSGIGTIAFSDPETNKFYALGHSVTDLDTSVDITIERGDAVEARINGVTPGKYGRAGELQGTFSSASLRIGSIESNGEFGIRGTLYNHLENRFFPNGLPIASADSTILGTAQILSTVDRDGVMIYNCIIVKLQRQTEPSPKGIIIEITDPVLIEKAGGIVQGMSGSPVIQNGKIVGVLTHVFLNDPLRGYCTYAEWVIDE